jgi:hypothetical protein
MPRSRGLLSPREFTDLVLEVACSTGRLRFFKACVDQVNQVAAVDIGFWKTLNNFIYPIDDNLLKEAALMEAQSNTGEAKEHKKKARAKDDSATSPYLVPQIGNDQFGENFSCCLIGLSFNSLCLFLLTSVLLDETERNPASYIPTYSGSARVNFRSTRGERVWNDGSTLDPSLKGKSTMQTLIKGKGQLAGDLVAWPYVAIVDENEGNDAGSVEKKEFVGTDFAHCQVVYPNPMEPDELVAHHISLKQAVDLLSLLVSVAKKRRIGIVKLYLPSTFYCYETRVSLIDHP